jgi:hypothetical protein
MNIAHLLVRRARRLIAPLPPAARRGTGAAATRPLPPPSDRTPGGGSADLEQFPPTVAEEALAARWLDNGDLHAARDLYDLAGSQDRAVAVTLRVRDQRRLVAESDEILRRAFGIRDGAR